MTVKEIVKEYLEKNGYDGLCNLEYDCGCLIEDFMPCSDLLEHCEPGYRGPCDCGEGCEFHVYKEKVEK